MTAAPLHSTACGEPCARAQGLAEDVECGAVDISWPRKRLGDFFQACLLVAPRSRAGRRSADQGACSVALSCCSRPGPPCASQAIRNKPKKTAVVASTYHFYVLAADVTQDESARGPQSTSAVVRSRSALAQAAMPTGRAPRGTRAARPANT